MTQAISKQGSQQQQQQVQQQHQHARDTQTEEHHKSANASVNTPLLHLTPGLKPPPKNSAYFSAHIPSLLYEKEHKGDTDANTPTWAIRLD